jgi:hypothetical protein
MGAASPMMIRAGVQAASAARSLLSDTAGYCPISRNTSISGCGACRQLAEGLRLTFRPGLIVTSVPRV